ncbi:MAG TPA: response regulator transcription factor [Thermoanaerobaculia bacterium]
MLADDHQVVREGLRRLLEGEPDFAVVGEVADGLAVSPLVKRLRPRVVVTDLMMPGIGGIEVTRQIRRHSPETRVVILSMHVAESFVLEALKGGAAAFVPKDAPGSELLRAVREAAAGRRYLSPPLSDTLIDALLEGKERPADPLLELTDREREVLHLSARGLTSKEIAQRLALSPRTAESHRANLMRKLGLKHQTDLVRFALQHGILPTDSP